MILLSYSMLAALVRCWRRSFDAGGAGVEVAAQVLRRLHRYQL
ncbi:MAG: hypothetical protein QF926_10985 [Alphaproteobacteria bacterium]|jgi:hypothetical protein|nr:hypothetical protein [Alphaproteobacteria bacterium]MDP6517132.1 hypothetical protein [Alphaproteobacteria bacterium]